VRIPSSTAPMKLLINRKWSSVALFMARYACFGPVDADDIHMAAYTAWPNGPVGSVTTTHVL
jgi:hypothetical protein